MLNADTDSFKLTSPEEQYLKNDVLATKKVFLNSIYGKVVTDMTKEYIVIHRDKRPMVIFRRSIVAVEKDTDGRATLFCSQDLIIYADEKYADVIKQLI